MEEEKAGIKTTTRFGRRTAEIQNNLAGLTVTQELMVFEWKRIRSRLRGTRWAASANPTGAVKGMRMDERGKGVGKGIAASCLPFCRLRALGSHWRQLRSLEIIRCASKRIILSPTARSFQP